jgi:membrane-bound serine protease (ClpP class)
VAQDEGYECAVIELDTPGGLMDSTQQIVKDILDARVAVIVYVSPAGGRAASAGLFITLSSHLAAMAPGTRIGAAHPVQIGGLPTGPQPVPSDERKGENGSGDEASRHEPLEEKIVNDTVAWAKGLAQMRGRNVEWAALAVSKSEVLTDTEAIRDNVVELQATDFTDLLEQIHGREVTVGQTTVRLRTADAEVRTMEMWWGERFLAVISNPNVVMFLMLFGVWGILFELNSPGWGVGGTLGVICLVLGFFGLSVLPVNYVALALIVIGLAMFVAEAYVTSFGTLTLGGIICLILGGTMLVDSPTGFIRVSLSVLVPIAVATGAISVFLLSRIVKAHRGRVQTGSEGLLEHEAVARVSFTADGGQFAGLVFVHGELWKARSETPIDEGESVIVVGRDGLSLDVEAAGHSKAAVSEPDST